MEISGGEVAASSRGDGIAGGSLNLDGVNRLGRVLQSQIYKTMQSPPVLDFGIIQEDYSLLTNSFPAAIPLDGYLVCRSVSYNPAKPLTMTWWAGEAPSVQGWENEDWSEAGWQGGGSDKHNPPDAIPSHGHGGKGESAIDCGKHYHDVYVPDKMRWIKPGDRVLVAWVGVDAVVVDLLYQAKEVIKNA